MKDKLKSDFLISSKGINTKTQFVSLSLTGKGSVCNPKVNSFRKKDNVKFKTTKSSPEKNTMNVDDYLPESKVTSTDKIKKQPEIKNKREINSDEYMKLMLIKKKYDTKKNSNYLNFTNPVYQCCNGKRENSGEKTSSNEGKTITPNSKSINSSINKLNRTKNSGQFVKKSHKGQGFQIRNGKNNIEQEKISSINTNFTSSVISSRDRCVKKKQINNFKNDTTNNIYSNHSVQKKKINKNPSKQIISPDSKKVTQFNNKNTSKGNHYNNVYALITTKVISQTTPVTNENSRKTSADKKIKPFPIKKNTILTYIGNHQFDENKQSNPPESNEQKHPVKPIAFAPSNIPSSSDNPVSKLNIITKKPIIEKKINNYVKNVLNCVITKPHLTTGNSPTHQQLNFRKFNNQIKPKLNENRKTNNKGTHVSLSLSKDKTKQNYSNSLFKSQNVGNQNKNNNNNIITKKAMHHLHNMKCSIKNNNFTSSNSKEVLSNALLDCNHNDNNIELKKKMSEVIISNGKSTSNSFVKKPKKTPIPKSKKENELTIVEKILQNQRNTNHLNENIKTNSIELNKSISSIKSTTREGGCYLKESDDLKNFISNYYMKNNEYPKTQASFYKIGRLIGRGAFGKVNLGLHILSGRIVAIKSFNKNNFVSESDKAKIYHETNLMKNFRHNSIVKIFEILETDKYILIVMENIAGGDLLSFVKKRTKLNEKITKIIFKQLMEAIRYIHSMGIIHRDIKLDNILIDLNNNIKLCDFGVGKMIKKDQILTDQCGTPAYIAPEILKNEGYEGFPVDLWSSGVVLYTMLSGTVPFKASNINDLHKLILKGTYLPIQDISFEANDLLISLLEIDPKKRITIDKVLSHPWLNISNEEFMILKMTLFTKAEMFLLSKANADYRTGNKDDLIEHFTIKNLDTLNDSENKNIDTKSIILAPFNSSLEVANLNKNCHLSPELIIENSVLKFIGKVKEYNRHYELNNNEDIDHSILINHSSEGESHSNYNAFPTPDNNQFSGKASNVNQQPNDQMKKESENELNGRIVNNECQKNNSIKDVGLLINPTTFSIDENILKIVENFGYNKQYMKKALIDNEVNYATATYYLIQNGMIFE